MAYLAEHCKSRYHKLSTCTWGDEKFSQLTPMISSGQSLWLYLVPDPDFSRPASGTTDSADPITANPEGR
jgi:hypothetical protein